MTATASVVAWYSQMKNGLTGEKMLSTGLYPSSIYHWIRSSNRIQMSCLMPL